MKLATIEKVLDKKPIDGADKIELVTVLGWNVVTKKDEYQIGDLCCYIPIDTTVNPTREYFKFLAGKKDPNKRIKIQTIKLKGVFSQGLLIKPTVLEDSSKYVEGDDVSELLDVQKYEKENIINQITGVSAQVNIPFPTNIISITDEDNFRTKFKCYDEFLNENVYVTLKMDGSSMTIINNNTEQYVCSRRLVLDKGAVMYQYVERENILDRIKDYNIAIQGEFCGPKINNNRMELKDYKYYVFNIKNLDNNKLLEWNEMIEFCKKVKLDLVPLLDTFKFESIHDITYFQDFANKVNYITPMNKKVPGEGIVIRPIQPKWSNELNKYLSVKIINQNYKD